MGVEPRYVTVAAELRKKIKSGEYPIGSTIPTEQDLCEHFAISRFTVRAALQILVDAGLVSRRPRAGTTVIADTQREPFAQTLRSLDDLLQYATDTKLEIIDIDKVNPKHRPRLLPAEAASENWVIGKGIRYSIIDRKPVSITHVYLPERYKAALKNHRERSIAIFRAIETMFDLVIHKVDQYISAEILSSESAKLLNSAQGDAALIITRAYYTEDNEIVELSRSIHSSKDYSYKSEISKLR